MMISVFHVLSLSLWPLMMSGAVLISFISLYLSMKVGFNMLLLVVILVMLNWFKDVSRESDLMMEHSFLSVVFFKTGMILFITSEVMFFVSFFWCYFDFVLAVDFELGGVWPPKGIQSINPFSIPLLNTLILLSSGVLITWTHFSILNNDWFYSVVTLFGTLVLGIYFLCIQFQEYMDATYTFMSSGYGSIFFLATGFHGFHVLLGCALISGSLYRMVTLKMDALSHYNFEFSAWYWHFVDVVWLFLFIFIYWWGY
uniref:Cytochrome c oxidase subunit 3 n=1 Tax=Macrotrachela quadricornifera TaxID=104788 RepID=J7KL15_9BILA|nr:cytochrome c oxidase subunit 3 [Macrotrachela quadricornifera]AFQ96960.1 cytochrome c oxidase subunit 3 [Macrotrachela quadricornifera]AFQ96961.1 cytochrome c oxidase subunit 3 [Macrotrachela quadricornifera]AFQ96962.1 cytochrome c oxidase subunit 3 [Macrotrachela quadricornifera]AFQ96965.1 cytochrome c oxidase subunit 3 [Macrotrachela quadricornifera]